MLLLTALSFVSSVLLLALLRGGGRLAEVEEAQERRYQQSQP